jgi:hypothetical protein
VDLGDLLEDLPGLVTQARGVDQLPSVFHSTNARKQTRMWACTRLSVWCQIGLSPRSLLCERNADSVSVSWM